MRNIRRVFSHELLTTITRPSFYIGLILVAVGAIAVFVLSTTVQNNPMERFLEEIFVPSAREGAEGFVDASGIITEIPQYAQADLLAFADEEQALQALQAGDIIGYYRIPADYLQSGQMEYVVNEANPFRNMEDTGTINDVIDENLLRDGTYQSWLVKYPLNLQIRQVAAQGQSGEAVEEEVSSEDAMLAYWIPYVVIFLFYIILMGSSTMMLNSVSSEKSNRVAEILITSVNPYELLIGKMLGLGLAGLIQTVVWAGTGLLLMGYSKQAGMLPDGVTMPPMMLLWLVVFFVLGYAVYASLMASLGALTASSKEAGQVTIIVIFPLIIPMMLNSAILQEPNGPISTALSLIPFTAPVVMPARLSIGAVPMWQVWLSLALLAGLVVFIVRSAGNLFHAQNLLSGDSVNIGNFLKAMLGLKYKAKVE